MSAPPPYEGGGNPDRRPLPDNWITEFDANYKAWYYVNTRANPPEITWNHPLGSAPATPQHYPPPPSAPPGNSGYGGYNSPPGPGYNQGPSGGGGYGYNNNQGSYSGYGGGGSGYPGQGQGQPPYDGGYDQNNDSGGRGLLGGLLGGRKHHHEHEHRHGGRYSPQPPPQVVYVQESAPPQKKHHGMGMAGGLALGAVGVLAFEEFGKHEREVGFDDAVNDFDGGGFDGDNSGGGFSDFF